MKPLIAIIGRPNVGKSTLFNRIVGERRAIVENVPGTTRDRIYGDAEWLDVQFAVVDTGGLQDKDEYETLAPPEISQRTQNQARVAIEEANVILFLVDGSSGVTSADYELADLLRRVDKPVVLGVNKTESEERRESAVEFYELGLGEPIAFSGLHGIGIGDVLDAVVENVSPELREDSIADQPAIAIVGRPNVGKSELLNALVGDDRSIVSEVAGTTRDAVDTIVNWVGNEVRLIDTAGIRRRGRVEPGIERYAVVRSMRAIDRADVVIVVLDATEGFTAQDAHIAGYVVEAGKGLILAVNKWDLIEKNSTTIHEFEDLAAEEFSFVPYPPLLFISAKTGQRVSQIVEMAFHVFGECNKRISTGELNRMLREAVARHPPPARPSNWLRFYYVTQVDITPPRFVFFVNEPRNVHFSYQRYLENEIRDRWQFTGSPIIMHFRRRRRD